MARRDTVTCSESKSQWIKVDSRSLILRPGPGQYYLLVLHTPSPDLMTTVTIRFHLLTNTIKAGGDYLGLKGIKCLTGKIYKPDSTEQMNAIKNQPAKQYNTEEQDYME